MPKDRTTHRRELYEQRVQLAFKHLREAVMHLKTSLEYSDSEEYHKEAAEAVKTLEWEADRMLENVVPF